MARRFERRWLLLIALLLGPLLLASASLARQATPPGEATPTRDWQEDVVEGVVVPTSEEIRFSQATDVFLGRVLGRARWVVLFDERPGYLSIERAPVSVTLYAVEVLDPIRGAATGVIIARQHSEWDHEQSSQAVGEPLLEIGEEAVFVTWRDRDREDWYTLVEGRFGHFRVNSAEERDATVARIEALVAVAATPAPNDGES